MTVFWDQGRHAQLLRMAAHRNGHTTAVRLDFTIDIVTDVTPISHRAIISVTFDELEQEVIKAIRYRDGYVEPICNPPFGRTAAGDDRITNICRYLDEHCPTNFTWHAPTRAQPVPEPEPLDRWPGTPAGLAPVTDINVKLRSK